MDHSFGGGPVDLGHGLDHRGSGRIKGSGLQDLMEFLNRGFKP
jgi:hypothetical protein